MTAFTGALGALTRVWGGSGTFLFPLEEAEAQHDLFWALVELFDPDAWEIYVPSGADLESLDATAFAARKKEIEKALQALPAVPEGEQDPEYDRAWAEPIADVDLSDDLNRLLVQRGSPFHHDGQMMLRGGFSGSSVPYPMVDSLDLAGVPESLRVPEVPTENKALRLIAAAQWGELSPAALQRIMNERFTPPTVPADGVLTLIRRLFSFDDPIRDAPFSLAEPGLVWLGARPRVETRFTVVAGETALDFCLAYALRRSRTLAYWWCPSAFESAHRDRAVHEIGRLTHRLGVPVDVTSVSDEQSADAMVQAMQSTGVAWGQIAQREWQAVIPEAANSLVFAGEPAHPQPYSIVEGTTPPLRMPSPTELAPSDSSKLRWIGEVEIEHWNCVRHRDLARSTVYETIAYDARSSQRGVAVQCPSSFVRVAVPLPWQLPRPRLGPLPLLDQLRAVAESGGWQVELSDKGVYTAGTMELFGGADALCRALENDEVQAVFYAYQDADPGAPGKRLRDRRRYLTLADLTTLPDMADAPNLVEHLEHQRVLVRGLVLKCGRCRHTDFYRADLAEPTFICPRCSFEQRPTRSAWLGTPEPRWHYRLDEVVFQFIHHRGEIPLLAAQDRFSRSGRPIAIVPEIRVGPAGSLHEVDFAVTDGDWLWFGEAFSAERYEETNHAEHSRLTELVRAVEHFNARGVVLATSAGAINAGTRKRAESVFTGFWPQLVVEQSAASLPRPLKCL